ncbi:hypothetical protein P691DRAFT_774558 [Macrolepiota fuliginosa MF-IS2]|uniref:Peptidase C14 caspase domain-containing protein n=1 Tax=Macrolepiota fuliginosa MF-IS2 TaxID=1400762 RepID=A0A9P5XH04_9AGAR|nr:hypothetical protein P691DRAFT_774558 [Macrolepiota fuliginosa MF-IS2]
MMWDLNGSSDESRSKPSRHSPNPAFPSPQLVNTSFAPANYPGNTSYMPMPSVPAVSPTLNPAYPQYYSQQYSGPSVPQGSYQAAPQVIIVKHSHRKHGHRSHSHSHSQAIAIPQPVTYSNSHPPYQQEPTVTYPQLESYPSPQQPLNERTGHISIAPHRQPSQPQFSAAPGPRSDGRFQYSNCTGRKKALCIGINYRGQRNELRGCINDAHNVRRFLIKQHGFRNEDIVLLTDETAEPRSLPTRKNLIDAMKWLVRSAKPHDSLFFHYSGHGGQVEDQDGDEVDGFDEVIFPLDFKENSYITDDEMHAIMVTSLPSGCRLTALFDSCHSGTVLDLPYIYSSHGRLKGEHIRGPARKRKDTCADVISWSGCKDGETSADTFKDGVAVGAMSHAFLQTLGEKPNQSYRELLRSVRLILQPKYDQKPQLGSSHQMDTSRKPGAL